MSLKSKIQSLLAAANAKTGESDSTLTDAVQTLCDGYGQGGGVDMFSYATELYRTFYGSANLPETVTISAPNCTVLNGTFSAITTDVREITVNAGVLTALRNAVVGGTTGSAVNTVTETLHLNAMFSNCNYQQAFQNAAALRTIDADLDFTGATSVSSAFANCTALEDIRFVKNSLSRALEMKHSAMLSDASLVSIANGLNPTAAQTLTLHAASFARCASLTGTVSDGAFTADAGGTVTLDDFITATKGWTLVSA